MWTGTELLLLRLLVELPTEGRESVPSSGGLSLQLGDEVVGGLARLHESVGGVGLGHGASRLGIIDLHCPSRPRTRRIT